ncbi:MAG: Smr/MutS family protein [Deltaproteobacteria bacterium]|nr:Smr/MutS family protein [Deltaproteobacteria bacterium]
MSRRTTKAARRRLLPGGGQLDARVSSEDQALFEQALRGELKDEAEGGEHTEGAHEAPSTERKKKAREKRPDDRFATPFAGLKDDWARSGRQLPAAAEGDAAAERAAAAAQAFEKEERLKREAATASLDDRVLFEGAAAGTTPLCKAPVVGAERQSLRVRPPRDDEAEVMAELADLVAGRSDFDTTFSHEHIEGIGEGIDRRLLKKLRKGVFSVRAHLDLHGFTRLEARPKVEAFFAESRRRHHRCVLIVHGRGLHSKDGIPVLKEAVGTWLMRGRIGRSVLAFCSARPTDGGLGALYVLLRR